jgi:hypothetical protein
VSHAPPHIGTLRERPLHASLKQWYTRRGDGIEVPVDGFVIDLVRGDLLIEVQTRGFSSMKRKLTALLELGHRFRIVHPVPVDKWIVKIDGDGTILGRRQSPKHGKPTDLFAEMVSFPELLVHPNVAFEVVLISEEEYRLHTPGKSWRRNGWSVLERRLVEVLDSVVVDGAGDVLGLLPTDLPDVFTTADLADGLGRPQRSAQQMAYCMRKAGLLLVVGKRGNTIEYRAAPATSGRDADWPVSRTL